MPVPRVAVTSAVELEESFVGIVRTRFPWTVSEEVPVREAGRVGKTLRFLRDLKPRETRGH
jgi:hypothetical protein